jgi:anthranilate phosphoribosyltransferase
MASNPVLTEAIDRVASGSDLSADDASAVLREVMAGEASEAQAAAFLIALRTKGETVDELVGLARTMRSLARAVDVGRDDLLDTAGTGGGRPTFNVSTCAAFVAAGAGCVVAKHGNRSATGRSGSADVLEALGAQIEVEPAKARALLDETGFCFLFAPAYHPGMKHAALVRRQLSVRTVMNLLGPCINPARPPVQLLGVADPRMLRRIALTLEALGVHEALVVHGSGLDEVALHGETRAIRLSGGTMSEIEIMPEDAGLERAPLSAVTGGDPAENARRLRGLLEGRGSDAERDIVILNAAALLHTAGKAATIKDAAALARDALLSGRAAQVLDRFIEASHG